MGTFNAKEILSGPTNLIPIIANEIKAHFHEQGYEVAMDALSNGGYDISITKGGIFKAVLGMRTALKVTILPQNDNICFDASVGIWGQQAIPTVISMLFFWPVIITQVWGMVEQSKLDDEALAIAKNIIDKNNNVIDITPSTGFKFCTNCGTKNEESANFCCACGEKM